jgi:hypothetical protein
MTAHAEAVLDEDPADRSGRCGGCMRRTTGSAVATSSGLRERCRQALARHAAAVTYASGTAEAESAR